MLTTYGSLFLKLAKCLAFYFKGRSLVLAARFCSHRSVHERSMNQAPGNHVWADKQHELLQAFDEHLLEFLSARDLSVFSCCSKNLRDMLYKRAECWAAAARAFLPQSHPALEGKNRFFVQNALNRSSRATCNLSNGQIVSSITLQANYYNSASASFAPDDNLIAILSDQRLAVFSAGTGALQSLLTRRVAALRPAEDGVTLGGFELLGSSWLKCSAQLMVAVRMRYPHSVAIAFAPMSIHSIEAGPLRACTCPPMHPGGVVPWQSLKMLMASNSGLAAIQYSSLANVASSTRKECIVLANTRTGARLTAVHTVQRHVNDGMGSIVWSSDCKMVATSHCIIQVEPYLCRSLPAAATDCHHGAPMGFSHGNSLLGYTGNDGATHLVKTASGTMFQVLPRHTFRGFAPGPSKAWFLAEAAMAHPHILCTIWDWDAWQPVIVLTEGFHPVVPQPWLFDNKFVLGYSSGCLIR
ncbi:hypothetical protein WJX73_000036 [Symbiochloris irregularis]|uniref:F-box domain-containing protein n=1 Tax=Symbiochloris irregularis TaxID=706552 RepID=A0AAW1NYE1_9CHLO